MSTLIREISLFKHNKRRRRKRALHAPPIQRKEARRKLAHVVETKTGLNGTAECVICLAPLAAYLMPAGTRTETVDGETQPSQGVYSYPTGQQLSDGDELLILRVCQHTFHGSCLTSWFLIERYDCPICRTIYFHQEDDEARSFAKRCHRAFQDVLERARNRAHQVTISR
ncbi:hypothetical protein K469DRAFT_39086 [Zopfia rhizophila CBS 207.26]|uniref:RING-type domain-containing protein n=1 Tax=Zopfia rhizophila CBS 207.26 TaxID=1314779 RepID=A0A6A6DEN1_9PEZI|nr:hypothetical protein K469DRAFT_39086 [Zopfia rhizophila CBS 207.26]